MKKRPLFSAAVFCLLSASVMISGAGSLPACAAGDDQWCGLYDQGSMSLDYADQFSVEFYSRDEDADQEDCYALIDIEDAGEFLCVPEGEEVPEDLDDDITVLQKPLENVYLVATSAMDSICAIGALDHLTLSGTNADGWYVDAAKEAMENGSLIYAGKYSAPDYETIVASGCGLAIESTMIYHSPEVQEKLESFGIPVLVERSSYENHPIGRTEWIKLYGVLFDHMEEAQSVFDEQKEIVESIAGEENTGKTVAFFSISTNGYVSVRKSDDYVAKMIELAGGKYVFDDLGESDNSLSTMNLQMEEFYAGAKDADFIVYNSTIEGELETIDQLLEKSSVLADFKAVQNNNAWCTGKNLFQETTSLGNMISDFHTMITEKDDQEELTYLHKLK